MRPNYVLAQNTGSIGATTYANPGAVPAGVLAAFNELGTGVALNGAAGTKVQLVLGTNSEPYITPLLTTANWSVVKQAYVAGVSAAATISGIPVGPSGGATYTIGVINREQGVEPFRRETYIEVVPASQAIETTLQEFIDQMNTQGFGYPAFFTAKTNKTMNIDVTGTSGTANVTVSNGTISAVYLATFDTNLATTAGNFVTAHAANMLADLGIVVTNPSAANLLFASSVAGNVTVSIANVTGDLAGTVSTPQAATTLILTAVDDEVILDVVFRDYLDGVASKSITQGSPGSGEGAVLRELEGLSLGRTSRFAQESTVLGSLPGAEQFVSATGQYLVYSILHQNDHDDVIAKAFANQELIIALESAVTGDLDTFFGV